MYRMNAGSGRRVDAVAVDGEARLEVPSRFAPGAENCEITYLFRRGRVLGDVPVTLEIKDKDNTVVVQNDNLADGGDREDKFNWDGRNTGGDLVTPQKSPYTVTLRVGDVITRTGTVNVEVGMLQISVTHDAQKLFMNDPEGNIEVYATVKLRRKVGDFTPSAVPLQVKWSFEVADENLTVNDSFEFDTSTHKKLGKKDNSSAIHFAAHTNSTAESDDNYQQTCKSISNVTGEHLGKAFINFKPSGVGGDRFTIRAQILEDDNSTVIIEIESPPEEVWRRINFSDVYTMHDETFLNNATTRANIAPAFETNAFVKYTRDTITNLAESLSVRYIGTYQSGGGAGNWPADYSPSNLESSPNQLQPTAQQLSDYAYTGTDSARIIAKNTAKTAIENKAALWYNAVIDAYRQSVNDWFSDAGINDTENSLLAVKYYHPKLSAQGTDGVTNFWPTGIEINLANPGSGLTINGDPDRATWRQVLGFNRGKISVIFKNYSSNAQLIATCRHEIGHGTKSVFKRDTFGDGDHSSSGLMTAFSGSSEFSNTCIQILRGEHR